MLRRCYSQNIDGLEEVAGVSPKKIVCAHGSLRWATCCKCKRKVSSTEIENDILHGSVAYCQAPCNNHSKNTTTTTTTTAQLQIDSVHSSPRTSSRKRTRSATIAASDNTTIHELRSDGSGIGICGGVMKPGITFFGETLNTNVKRCLEADRNKVDALIVIGTSLSV
jgi:NAD+-dependent protein deacetylase SIR2